MAATKNSTRRARELEAVYRALDGRSFEAGDQLAAELFKTYQKLFAPTVPLSEFAAMLTAGRKRGWLIEGPGAKVRVDMPPVVK